MNESANLLLAAGDPGVLKMIWFYVQIFLGFSFIIFIHELGHFMVAKWAGVRVEQFAVGFFREIWGFTWGETRYSFNLLPLGGYVKMLGQEDFEVDTTGELQYSDDPRSFANKPVGHRMAIVSAGVIMNLILAAALFMIVFMVGKKVQAPRVGAVSPDGPAAIAGLQSGDVIRKIDGTEIDEFLDIQMAVTLAKPGKPLDVVVDRDGEERLFRLEPERGGERNALQLGLTSPSSAVIVGLGPEYDTEDPHDPRIGDKVVEVGGQPVTDENANEMMNVLLTNPLDYPQVVVERPVNLEAEDGPTERVTVNLRPQFRLVRVETGGSPLHLLGMVPLVRIATVEPGGRAELAGIEEGDTIVQWDDIEYPSAKQIKSNLKASAKPDDSSPETDIPLRVLRKNGQVRNLVVRPKVKIVPITGKRYPPTIQATFDMYADDLLVVGEVVDEVFGKPTAAAQAGIPVGAKITAVEGETVTHWVDLAEALRKRAGEKVTLTYDLKDEKGKTCTLPVPHSLRTALDIGPEARIVSVAGKERLFVDSNGNAVESNDDEVVSQDEDKDKSGKKVRASVTHPIALRAVLAQHLGETIEIKYRPHVLDETVTAKVTVTEEMLYPWVGSVLYFPGVRFGGDLITLQKGPVDALKRGAMKTYFFIVQVYQVMERMIISRSLGVENISGPVGIVKMGGAMAERGTMDLLYFLAIISANLAVINFLPLPIVDGGLMVFLIIEKIKGSPISMRVQVATQVVGLILIVTAFLFVTVMDITR